ncbi:hypothetical protein ACX8XP_13100 [Calditrichota bacterium LG25]
MNKKYLLLAPIIFLSCVGNYFLKFYPEKKLGLEGLITFVYIKPFSATTIYEIDLKKMELAELGKTNIDINFFNPVYNNDRIDLSTIKADSLFDSTTVYNSIFSSDQIIFFKKDNWDIYDKNILINRDKLSDGSFEIRKVNIKTKKEELIFIAKKVHDSYFSIKKNILCYAQEENGKRKLFIRDLKTNVCLAEIELHLNYGEGPQIDLSDNGEFVVYADYFAEEHGEFLPKLYLYDIKNKTKKLLMVGKLHHCYSSPRFINKDWIIYNYLTHDPFFAFSELHVLRTDGSIQKTLVRSNDCGSLIPFTLKK